MTFTEAVILSQGLAILLALGFVCFAIVFRSWAVYTDADVTWGRVALEALADGGNRVLAASQPTVHLPSTGARPLKTLVPTFTPMPLPTVPASAAAGAASSTRPTPTPMPALPTATRIPPTPAAPVVPPTPVPPPVGSPPTRLVIPDIHLDTPVEPVGYKTVKQGGKMKAIWTTPSEVAGFHEASAYPGQPGNTVINGHRDIYGAVFWNLNRVRLGDKLELYVDDQRYDYTVTEILEVRYTGASAEELAEHWRLMGQMPEERLTLITCTPVVLATHRLYVIAKPPDDPAVDRRQST